MTIVTLGIDLGKNLNAVVGLDAAEQVVLRRRVRRATLAELADSLPPCTVAMEACCGAHHVGRLFAAKGRTPPSPEAWFKKRRIDAEPFMRTRTRGSPPLRGQTRHYAGYVCARPNKA